MVLIYSSKAQWIQISSCSVTEAGEGEDGRMKSAIGIGSLLMDGLGDTIRVSLTEDPEYEMAPCRSFTASLACLDPDICCQISKVPKFGPLPFLSCEISYSHPAKIQR